MPKHPSPAASTAAPSAAAILIRPQAYNLDLEGVMAVTGLSRGFIYELIATNNFPKPAKFGTRSMWFGPAVEAWIAGKHGVAVDVSAA